MTHYQFYYSRWHFLGTLLTGFGLIMVGLALVLMKRWWFLIFGVALILLGLFAQLIILHRLLTDPVVLDVGPKGITYRYGTFSNKKLIWLPWANVQDIKLGDLTYENYGADVSLPVKLEYITIIVTDGFLKDYSMFKENIFITGNELRITTSNLRKFNATYLLAGVKANR